MNEKHVLKLPQILKTVRVEPGTQVKVHIGADEIKLQRKSRLRSKTPVGVIILTAIMTAIFLGYFDT